MRKTIPIVVTAILVAVGVAHAQPAAPPKIGVFDAARISEETDEGKRIQQSLTRFRDTKQAEISAKETEVADLQNQLNTQALSLSPERRSTLEKEIQRKVLDLNQARAAASREMQLEVGEAQTRFQDQLLAVVESFGRDEGFDLILERGLVAFAAPTIDVTTALVDRFNRMVPAQAEPASSGE